MQVKKEYILQNIINCAKDEFFLYGYTNASIRNIAFSSKINSSNLYRYFASKMDLFEYIIEPQYKKIQDFYKTLQNSDFSIQQHIINDELIYNIEHWTSMFDIFFCKESFIILNADENTNYNNCSNELITNFINGLKSFCGWTSDMNLPDKYPLQLYSEQLLSNLINNAKKLNGNKQVKAILKNQFISTVEGFVIALI